MTFRSCPPSSADRWGQCPRSVALSNLAPQDEQDNWHSVRGHVLHTAAVELFATMAKDANVTGRSVHQRAPGFLADAYRKEGEVVGEVGYKTSDDDVAALSQAVYQAIEIADPLDAIAIHLEADFPPPRWLPMRHTPRLDLVFHAGDGGMGLIDYKFGKHPVRPDSPQLLIYGDTLFEYYPTIEQLELWVVQPPNGPLNRRVTREECRKELDSYVNAAIDVQLMEPTNRPEDYNPGSWCHFCPARGICPAHTSKRHKRAVAAFGDLIEKD